MRRLGRILLALGLLLWWRPSVRTSSCAFARGSPGRRPPLCSTCRRVAAPATVAETVGGAEASAGFNTLDAAWWNEFGQRAGLHVGAAEEDVSSAEVDAGLDTADMQKKMVRDGYIKLPRECWDAAHDDAERLERLVSIIDKLDQDGLPPQFMLVYDEVWQLVNAVSSALHPLYGLQNVMDFYVFNVRPGKTGWLLHRDRPSGQPGFTPDGLPQYTTVWVALTDASPETSCIYVLPAFVDPEYKSMSGSKYDQGVATHFLNHVRALPVKRGTVLAWSHRILHWGSASPPEAPEARKTLTFAMASPSYEQPLIELKPGELPPFGARLALIAYTLICYHHSAPVSPAMQRELVEVMRQHSGHLTVAALLQATGQSFFKSLSSFCKGADAEQFAKIQQIGEQMLERFGMKSDWWAQECSSAQR